MLPLVQRKLLTMKVYSCGLWICMFNTFGKRKMDKVNMTAKLNRCGQNKNICLAPLATENKNKRKVIPTRKSLPLSLLQRTTCPSTQFVNRCPVTSYMSWVSYFGLTTWNWYFIGGADSDVETYRDLCAPGHIVLKLASYYLFFNWGGVLLMKLG